MNLAVKQTPEIFSEKMTPKTLLDMTQVSWLKERKISVPQRQEVSTESLLW